MDVDLWSLWVLREVWPGEEFGTPGLSVDEEMEVMQSILYNTTAGELAHSHSHSRPVPMFLFQYSPWVT